MKVVSDYIDNTKVRLELYNFNQAVKQVFSYYRCLENGIVVPTETSVIRNMPLMSKSFFIRNAKIFDFMKNAAISTVNLNLALKTKCYTYEFREPNRNMLIGPDDKEVEVSIQMTQSQIDDVENHKGLKYFRDFADKEPLAMYELSLDDISELADNAILTRIIGDVGEDRIHIIMTRDLIPMVKRCHPITIRVYAEEGLPPHIYPIMIVSESQTWTFYTIQHIVV